MKALKLQFSKSLDPSIHCELKVVRKNVKAFHLEYMGGVKPLNAIKFALENKANSISFPSADDWDIEIKNKQIIKTSCDIQIMIVSTGDKFDLFDLDEPIDTPISSGVIVIKGDKKFLYITEYSGMPKSTGYSLSKAILDYASELTGALDWKDNGTLHVCSGTAGEDLAKGRKLVPIDEYISMWENGLKDLTTKDVNPEDYNY